MRGHLALKIQGASLCLSLDGGLSLALSRAWALNLALALSRDLSLALSLALLALLAARWLLVGARVVQQAVQQAVAGRLRHAARGCLLVLPA